MYVSFRTITYWFFSLGTRFSIVFTSTTVRIYIFMINIYIYINIYHKCIITTYIVRLWQLEKNN